MQLKGCKLNVIGDSITEGVGTSDISRVFWKLLETCDGMDVAGYGISGTRIANQKVPSDEPILDRYFRTRVPEMRPDADVVLVFGGTNDYGHGDAPLGKMKDRTDNTFYGALHLLYQDLLEKYPEAVIAVMTPLHRTGEHRMWNDIGLRNVGCLEDYVNIIEEVAAYYSLPVIDLYRESGIQPDVPVIREKYMPDGLHPSDDGNRKVYEMIRRFLVERQ